LPFALETSLSLISDLMSDSVRATGLSALMKGAGQLTRFIPIPQPMLLVGPGSSARLGQAIAGFGHRKLLVVTDSRRRRSWAC
jgi:alcohol dehydrogenase